MSAVFADHRKTIAFSMFLDNVSDVTQICAGSDGLNPYVETFMGCESQPIRLNAWLADHKSFTGITMVAILDKRNINVNDISTLQYLVITGNAMANDVID